jgi:hypothetical protein
VSEPLQKLIDIINLLMGKGFFGSLTIKFENGKIVIVKKEESIKL